MNSATEGATLTPPPLSLYVHLPWCVRKCPYCDFNSHALKNEMPAERYIDALMRDLEVELPLVWGRPVQSVFFGGGTPSLFSAAQVERMLSGFRGLLDIVPGAEVTLEANPGTVERDSFSGYRDAGVNRVSLGVQSFDDRMLEAIGRIHGRAEARQAAESLAGAGMESFNLDLMFGLPGQSLETAVADVQTALAYSPPHLSHYQLTLEPNTCFHARPPSLPADDESWEMQGACADHLEAAGMVNYEISAWSGPGRECRHNLNYWRYGDFMGIGAGAHGKLTEASAQTVRRRIRIRHPRNWMESAEHGMPLAQEREINPQDRVFEFFLNQLRLRHGIRKADFSNRTGLPWLAVSERVEEAVRRGLLDEREDLLVPTESGWRFVNEIQQLFLP
ncbi:MAG: oxygen-independent coproporphyrinogen III oxidase-like protein [Xanthomonadales bacterium]|nr:radical SAM family heme chaperone HemW [Gammaproteobacteria bacterium]NNL05247.1 oxygen-independent coproporphyrinogen III oxidase-like protein [Xanthomonadales bacterium]